MRAILLSSCFILLGALGACGNGATSTTTGSGGTGGTAAATTSSSSTGGLADGGGGSNACDPTSKIAYVLASDRKVYKFEPDKKLFTDVFTLKCQTPPPAGNTTWAVSSMAVGRDGSAWFNYVATDNTDPTAPNDVGGVLLAVNLLTHECNDGTPVAQLVDASNFRFNAVFLPDAASDSGETLYLVGAATPGMANSLGLSRLDLKSHTIFEVGQFTGSALVGQSASLAVTPDARLYGLFSLYNPQNPQVTPIHVAAIDAKTGATPASTDISFPTTEPEAASAILAYGGDLYVFTAPDPKVSPSKTTSVMKYHPGDATGSMFMADIGFTVISASTSTCAP